jgi:hypothetical protein
MTRICFFSFPRRDGTKVLPVLSIGTLNYYELKLLKATVQAQCDSQWPSLARSFHIGPTYLEDPVSYIRLGAQLDSLVNVLREPNRESWGDDAELVHDIRNIARAHIDRIIAERRSIPTETATEQDFYQPNEIEWLKLVTVIASDEEPNPFFSEASSCLDGRYYHIDGPLINEDNGYRIREYLYHNTEGFIRLRLSPHQHSRPPMMRSLTEEAAEAWLSRLTNDSNRDLGLVPSQKPDQANSPSQAVRQPYSDPDNYDRNRWLYEQRAAGKKNKQILDELSRIAYDRGFAPIESENALRAAIESYAEYEGIRKIDGQRGRPRSNSGQPTNGESTGE